MNSASYPIGTPGTPWGEAEKAEWRSRQVRRRSYADDVLSADRTPARAFRGDAVRPARLCARPLSAASRCAAASGARSCRARWSPAACTATRPAACTARCSSSTRTRPTTPGAINLLVAPCISPWAYERIHRWNPRGDRPEPFVPREQPGWRIGGAVRLVAPLRDRLLVHVDLHETTDTDESEFRPALAARDGKPFEPDGDSGRVLSGRRCRAARSRSSSRRSSMRSRRSRISRRADAQGRDHRLAPGRAGRDRYRAAQARPRAPASPTRATRPTTEVYPDSPRATPEQCNRRAGGGGVRGAGLRAGARLAARAEKRAQGFSASASFASGSTYCTRPGARSCPVPPTESCAPNARTRRCACRARRRRAPGLSRR